MPALLIEIFKVLIQVTELLPSAFNGKFLERQILLRNNPGSQEGSSPVEKTYMTHRVGYGKQVIEEAIKSISLWAFREVNI